MRYFIQISYKGNLYKGWQKQANTSGCIQEIIESAINAATKSNEAKLIGCGRTDAGVHAKVFYAHIDWKDDLIVFLHSINYILPTDIAIHKIVVMHSSAHARFDAIARAYEYHFHFYRDPFLEDISAYYDYPSLDYKAMTDACNILKQKEDFEAFCKTPLRNRHTKCTIMECRIEKFEGRAILYVRANRFLKSMVRIIVYELLNVGLGKLSLEQFEALFYIPRKQHISKIAHPQGLFLTNIVYPYAI